MKIRNLRMHSVSDFVARKIITIYITNFPSLFSMLSSRITNQSKLMQVFVQSIYFQQLVSYSVRITDICPEDIQKMKIVADNLFKACALFDARIIPSLWCFTNAGPCHASYLFHKLQLGLGINTMEGREQKHQMIGKYALNSTYQNRWEYIFRHEYIQLIYLRENGFDNARYRKRKTKYIPDMPETGHCISCTLKLAEDCCVLCDSVEFKKVKNVVHKK